VVSPSFFGRQQERLDVGTPGGAEEVDYEHTTSPRAISMVEEGIERMSADPTQEHDCLP